MANTVQQYTPEEIAKSKEYIDGYIRRAREAQAEIENYTQSQVDRLLMAIAVKRLRQCGISGKATLKKPRWCF